MKLSFYRLKKNEAETRQIIREASRFDAADFLPSDKGFWARADALSINGALNKTIRERMRRRARFLIVNNAYASGAASAVVQAVAGTLPRLQLNAEGADRETLTRIENDFVEWAEEVNLADKLRSMRYARFVDGETFAILHTNPNLNLPSGVQLDVRPIDCDRVVGECNKNIDPLDADGIRLDKFGDPVSYRVLDYNPGDAYKTKPLASATVYPATNVCHWFKQLYPEQKRGFSELASTLSLFLLVDRYSKAVVQAAETAASLAMVFTTDTPSDSANDDGGDVVVDGSRFRADGSGDAPVDRSPQSGVVPDDKPFVEFPWMRGMTVTLPEGWDAKQISAEQPSNSYGMLVDEILAQIGAAINVPKLLMKNSAEKYNYSSARVDLQNFQNAVRLDRDSLRRHVLNPIWRAWFLEYRALNRLDVHPTATWYFDGFFHVDPLKEANAQIARVDSALSSLAAEYGARGLDWERELQQIAREKSFIKELEEKFGIVLSKDKDGTLAQVPGENEGANGNQ